MRNHRQQYRLAAAAVVLIALPGILIAFAAELAGDLSIGSPRARAQSPGHYYVARRGDAFEYAKVSTGDSASKEFVLVWYQGTRGGEPSVRYQDGSSSGTLTCYEDCQFVRGTTLTDGEVVHYGRIRVTNNPLIYEIIEDARAGYLLKR